MRGLKNANGEWEPRNTSWIWDGTIKIGKQRPCQKAKVVKYRARWRGRGKKNKCKPLRINSLISLWGRMKKRGFPPPILSALLWYLSSLLSHILISLASIHPVGTHSPRVRAEGTRGKTPLDAKLALLLPTSLLHKYHLAVRHHFLILYLLHLVSGG